MNANPLSGYLCRYGTVGTNSEGERMSERHFYATGALLPYSLNCYHGEIWLQPVINKILRVSNMSE